MLDCLTAAMLQGSPFMLLQKGHVEDKGAQPTANTKIPKVDEAVLDHQAQKSHQLQLDG